MIDVFKEINRIFDEAAPKSPRVYLMAYGGCSTCDKYCDGDMMPSHHASDRCESGKRNHCSCDVCF